MSIAACRLRAVDGRGAGLRRRPQPRRVLGERRGRHARVRRCAGARADAADATCRRRCRSAPARWPRSWASMPPPLPQACDDAAQGEVVSAANINGGGQVVIAGARDAVARAGARAKALGARRVIPLQVSAPFHCALMKPAAGSPRARTAAHPRPRSARADRRERGCGAEARRRRPRSRRSIAQVSSPVRWEDVVRRLASEGVTTYVEVGPGTVLSGMVRQIHREATVANIAGARRSCRPIEASACLS